MIGCVAMRYSYAPNAHKPAAPVIKGVNVCHEFHGYRIPPQDNGIRKDAVLVVNRKVPMKSIFLHWLEKDILPVRKLDDHATNTNPMPINGKLM